jgi:peptidoglycan/LPS O-acetylase OafA/YrhL
MPKQIPQLDAVRGVAILVVMVHNLHGFFFPPLSLLTNYGWMGVDLFFVLSGFLITGILLDTKPSNDFFRNFYARRCLRIWPLYYSVLVLMFVLLPLLRPQNAAEIFHRSDPWWSYPFFLQNFLVADPALSVGPLGVSWSLAVEELFYLVWPLFVRFLSPARLQIVAWCVFLFSPVLRFFVDSRGWLIYSNPFCRVDGLMAGALLALLVRKSNFSPSRWLWPAWISLLVAAPLALFTDMQNARWLTFSMDAIASAGFIYVSMFSQNTWLKQCMTNRFLMFSGTISYGLYLLHKIPEDMFKANRLYLAHPQVAFWTAAVISYALAIASWNLLEKPFLRLKRFFENDAPRSRAPEVPLATATDSETT